MSNEIELADKSAQPKDRTPEYRLLDLFLLKATVGRGGLRDGPLPAHVTTSIKIEALKDKDNQSKVAFMVTGIAEGNYEDQPGPPAFNIEGTFWVAYELDPKAVENEKYVTQMAEKAPIFHVWPYWREFVSSASSRMGLPPLRMPLLFPGSLRFEMEKTAKSLPATQNTALTKSKAKPAVLVPKKKKPPTKG